MCARMRGRNDHDGSALAQFLRTSTLPDGHLKMRTPHVFELRAYDGDVPIFTATLRFNDGWSRRLWIRDDGSFEVNRKFPAPGRYTGTITVTGARVPSLSRMFDLWANSTGWCVNVSPAPKEVQHGEFFQARGKLDVVDPGLLSGVIDYGDGSGELTLTVEPDSSFVLRHLYLACGRYFPRVTIHDRAGRMATGYQICNVVPRAQSSAVTLLERP
jgi:hypothetical protein